MPVNLPATKTHPVNIANLPHAEPLVIYPHDGPVLVTLPTRGDPGELKTVACSERATNRVVVILGRSRANVYPGGKIILESRRKWWSRIAELFVSRPHIRWVCVG